MVLGTNRLFTAAVEDDKTLLGSFPRFQNTPNIDYVKMDKKNGIKRDEVHA